MAWTWTMIAIAVLVLLMLAYLLREFSRKSRNPSKKLPPGPRGFPILGNLHLLMGELPHRDLHRLAQKHGPIMYLRLGLKPAIVVSTPQAAELFLKEHDHAFASRPFLETAKHISYERKSLVLAPYGSYWRNMRKMCTFELLTSHKIKSFRSMRKEELGLLINFLQQAAANCAVVDLGAKVLSLNADMACNMVVGKKYKDNDIGERGFKAVIQEVMQISAAPNLSDCIPCIASLDFQGLTRRMKALSKTIDDFLEKIIDEHDAAQTKDKNKTNDFVDAMLNIMGSKDQLEYSTIERSNVKALTLDMLIASMDTSATAIEWALSELMRHPRVMKKLQKELENVVGMKRMVEEEDLDKLEYLDMVVKESFRLHPVAPLLIPHEGMEDCTVNGFHIPKNSRILINTWAIGRDPSVWNDAEVFFPERFVRSSIDLRGRDFRLLPFGSGKRGCPGIQLGLLVVRLVIAQLVHCFDWELPDNMVPTELNMTEQFGLSAPRAQHLLAIPAYRLQE